MPPLSLEITDADIQALETSSNLTFDHRRTEILKSLDTIDVQACPGSGKTTLIAAKLMLCSQKWRCKDRGICVLSHTNVAKNEIIHKIERSKLPEAKNLLSYPHFIGTIQDFIDTFLALPLLRSSNTVCRLVDNNEYHTEVAKASWPIVEMVDGQRMRLNTLALRGSIHFGDFSYLWDSGAQNLTVNASFSERLYRYVKQQNYSLDVLRRKKLSLSKQGVFLYKDMYALSECILCICGVLRHSLRQRFPLVFIDEMQDTQKFQDELLQEIFPLNVDTVSVQRLGDPDQAIFNSINDEVPNESYNGKSRQDMDFVIDKSHRFDTSICNKIKRLSFNEVELDTDLSDIDIEERRSHHSRQESFKHSIFIYEDGTIDKVLPSFAKLVVGQFSEAKRNSASFSVKALGAVGKEIDPSNANELKIGHYWNTFDKDRTKNNFKENHFIEAVYFVNQAECEDCFNSYKFLSDCLIKLLRIAGKKDDSDKFFTTTSLRKHLVESEKWDLYRRILHGLLNNRGAFKRNKWHKICYSLTQILEIDLSDETVKTYLEFKNIQSGASTAKPSNFADIEGIRIELSTIHGAKGETHDATIVLETKSYNYDLYAMLPYLNGDKPDEDTPNQTLKTDPTNVRDVERMPNQRFMRQLYVAMSRPQHLLCLAIHRDRITDGQIDKLRNLDWEITPLYPPTS